MLMSYGGHDEHIEHAYSPTFRELSEIHAWEGPSGATRDLDAMLAMMLPVDGILQSRPRPEGVGEERYESSIRNSLAFLNSVHACLDALANPTPCERPLSFANVVYLAGVYVREQIFDKALAEERIDQYDYDESMEDLLQAAAEICSAFDLVILRQSLPQQRTGSLLMREFRLDTPSTGGASN